MKKTSVMLALGLASALAAGTAMAQTNSPAHDKMANKTADKASQKFIKAAIEGDIAEIDVGKLAQEKGQSEAVKQYGAMLVKDHGDHKAKAEEVASQLGVTPPTGSSFGEKATYAKLKLLSGDTFDRSFAKSMVKDHQDDIKEYRKEASKSDAAGQLAKETLPTLRKHLQAAQRLSAEKQSSR
jgi:putative membrane protein